MCAHDNLSYMLYMCVVYNVINVAYIHVVYIIMCSVIMIHSTQLLYCVVVHFNCCTVVVSQEEHCSFLVYQLPAGLPLANAYSIMEQGREHLDIDGYSLSQTTLDDVSGQVTSTCACSSSPSHRFLYTLLVSKAKMWCLLFECNQKWHLAPHPWSFLI